jgi:tRNA A-37 threonylcarbamoyl transferase component Bud32
MLSKDYTDPNLQEALRQAGYTDFDSWWNVEGELVEEGNFWGKDNTTQWSHVSRVQLPEGKVLYLKRQQNHFPGNAVNRILGILTFELEWKNYQRLQAAGVPTMKIIRFASRKQGGNRQCILVAEELEGMIPVKDLVSHYEQNGWPPRKQRLAILAAILQTIKKMHSSGIIHNALTDKHIFINIPISGGVAIMPQEIRTNLIDFERTKYPGAQSRKLISSNLRELYKKRGQWPSRDFLWFLKKYLEIDKLTRRAKIIARQLAR